jgi:sulfatase maturation enzyme AslB (radical SAM superfamily)
MKVSINPSYFCNFRCSFCYLTKEQLGDQKRIDPEKLDKLLSQIPEPLEHVDLYGGEIGALKKQYYYEIKDVIKRHYSGIININTNFSMLDERFFEDDISLSVSYDFDAREKSDLVFQNMLMSKKPIAVLILASKDIINKNVDEMIQQLNMCSAVVSVEIKPYSINQANADHVTHKQYEEFVLKFHYSPIEKKFNFVNLDTIYAALDKEYSSWSDDHVYITPNGKFAVLEFDNNDREFFLELPSYHAFETWAWSEKRKISSICHNCAYKGHCLTEHYRFVRSLKDSCNGYINLLAHFDK